MNNKLKSEGWYLLSGISGETCKDIINSYNPSSYLDISSIYIPLYSDFSSNIFQLSSLELNIPTDISVSELVFNETIGTILPYDEYRANHFGRVIDISNIKFSESVGFWVYMYQIETNPILRLDISLLNITGQPDDKSYPTILSIDGQDTSLITSRSFDISRNDISINLVVERTFPFKYNEIFTATVLDNDYTGFNGTSGNSNNNDISFINFTGIYPDLSMNTDLSSNTGKIIFTVKNSTPDSDQSFNVTINIDVSDTIYPIIEFIDRTNPNINYIYNNPQHYRGTNNNNHFNTTIKLNQSYIRDNPEIDLSPNVNAYDQIDNIISENINNNIIKTYIPSAIPDPNITSINMPQDISYTAGEWRPGIYKIIYSVSDSFNHETIVDVSFEIIDDIYPIITVSNDSINTVYSYKNISFNSLYTTKQISGGLNDTSGIGFELDNLFNSITHQTYVSSQNLYIYYSSVKSSEKWLFPIVTQRLDFSNIDISLTNLDISNTHSNINTDASGIYIVSLNTTNTYTETTSLIRKYELTDYYDLSSTIILNVDVYDDTIPLVDVSFIHTIFKIDTSNSSSSSSNDNNVYSDISAILVHNSIQSTPIIISLYDNITFHFSMNKKCKCQIEISGNIVSNPINVFDTSHSIELTESDTSNVGIHDLVFTIWDENHNFYKFKKDISINDIPSYTLQIIHDQYENDTDKKQKLLLRVAQRTHYDDYLAFMSIQTNKTWDISFTDEATVYTDNKFGLIDTYYAKTFIGTSGKFLFSVKPGGHNVPFSTNSIDNGTYYELIYFPQDPSLNITEIKNFWVNSDALSAALSIAENYYNDVTNYIGFYNNTINVIHYNT
jgi:hypothetical protein